MKTQRERLLSALEQGRWHDAWEVLGKPDGSVGAALGYPVRKALVRIDETFRASLLASMEVQRILHREKARSAPDPLTAPNAKAQDGGR